MAPRPYTSEATVGGSPSSTSGAVNAGQAVIVRLLGGEATRDPRDSEVAEQGVAVVVEQDVRGFDVAMQDAGPVCGLDRTGQTHTVVQDLRHRQRTTLANPGVQ